MVTVSTELEALRTFLGSQPPGPITRCKELAEVLSTCWHEFRGGGEAAMRGGKLIDPRGEPRLEAPVWHPPVLEFEIVRHGGAVLGSKRGERQRWRLDLSAKTADTENVGYVQLVPNERRLNIPAIANELVHLITSDTPDPGLKRTSDGTVTVLMGKVLREGKLAKQTIQGRRKRLREELEKLLQKHGWHTIRPNVYKANDN